jgi:hypothetical protein
MLQHAIVHGAETGAELLEIDTGGRIEHGIDLSHVRSALEFLGEFGKSDVQAREQLVNRLQPESVLAALQSGASRR